MSKAEIAVVGDTVPVKEIFGMRSGLLRRKVVRIVTSVVAITALALGTVAPAHAEGFPAPPKLDPWTDGSLPNTDYNLLNCAWETRFGTEHSGAWTMLKFYLDIENLDCRGRDIARASDVEFALNLVSLDLSNNQITDLSSRWLKPSDYFSVTPTGFSGLTKLESMSLADQVLPERSVLVGESSKVPVIKNTDGSPIELVDVDGLETVTDGHITWTTPGVHTLVWSTPVTAGNATTVFNGSIKFNVDGDLGILSQTEFELPIGREFTHQIVANGMPSEFTFTESGGLPPGIAMDAAGKFTGAPTTAGDYRTMVTLSNGVQPDVVREFVFTVQKGVAPTITPEETKLPDAHYGEPYSIQFAAVGFPTPAFQKTMVGLPTGLTFDPKTGVLSGTPSGLGDYSFTIKANNSLGQETWKSYSTTTLRAPEFLPLPYSDRNALVVGAQANLYASIAGYPRQFMFTVEGDIPDGLSIDDSGAFVGVPTTAGKYPVKVTASNGVGDPATVELVIVVSSRPEAPAITSKAPAAGRVGEAYSHTLTSTGAPAATYAVAEGALPDGLSLNELTGEITGVPSKHHSFSFTIEAKNSAGTDSAMYTIDVAPASPVHTAPVITSKAPAAGRVGEAYSHTLTSTGAPAATYTVTEGALPDGLSLDSASGKITGKPSKRGPFSFTIKATNSEGTDSAKYTVKIEAAKVVDPVACEDPRKVSVFTDVPVSQKFYREIDWMHCKKLSTGYSDKTYRPKSELSREAMAAFMYRLEAPQSYKAPKVSPFTDVPTSHKFYTEIAWMKESKLSTGYADGSYRPKENLSREAMAAFIYRLEAKTSKNFTPPKASPFTDVSRDQKFSREIAWMKHSKLSTGYADGSYQSKAALSREAMAAFIYRLVTVYRTSQ